MTRPLDDLAALKARLSAGDPDSGTERTLPPPPPPMYRLSDDTPDELSIVLVVGQSGDGVWRATIALPRWHELPQGWDGPHEMPVAIKLANDYAANCGYDAIATDIESSQLWQAEWGKLTQPSSDLGG